MYSRMYNDMEALIHHLEQEAYSAVLRAFKAQSDALTWDKESLITELRKELRVSDDEHRELLSKVNGDDVIRRIREWRQTGGHQNARFSASQPVHDLTSPMSRKKQKTSQGTMQYHSIGPIGNRHRRGSSGVVQNEPSEVTTSDPLIGKRVWTKWPEDNNFYEAVITKYNPVEGRHALVYDINTERETWEWVDLREIPSKDIMWEGEDPGIPYRGGGHGGSDFGIKPPNHGDLISVISGRRVSLKDQSRREFPQSQNGFAKRVSDEDEIELLNTETLVKEVEKVFGLSQPDPLELEKAKKMLKEHEQALIEAIARLADASDGESDGGQRFLRGDAMEGE